MKRSRHGPVEADARRHEYERDCNSCQSAVVGNGRRPVIYSTPDTMIKDYI